MVLELFLSTRMKDRGAAGISHRDLHSSTYPVTLQDTGLSHFTSTDVSDWGCTSNLGTGSSPKTRQEEVIKHHHFIGNTVWTEHLSGIRSTFLPIHWYFSRIRAPHCISGSQVDLFNPLGEIEKAVAFLSYTQSLSRFLWFNSVCQVPAIGTKFLWGLKWDEAVVKGKFQVKYICDMLSVTTEYKQKQTILLLHEPSYESYQVCSIAWSWHELKHWT